MRKGQSPQITVRLCMEPQIVRGGWFADVQVVCEFFSVEDGLLHEVCAPLTSKTAKNITDYLLFSPRLPRFFVNSENEKKRISKYIAETLAGCVARKPEWYRARKYPTKFAKY